MPNKTAVFTHDPSLAPVVGTGAWFDYLERTVRAAAARARQQADVHDPFANLHLARAEPNTERTGPAPAMGTHAAARQLATMPAVPDLPNMAPHNSALRAARNGRRNTRLARMRVRLSRGETVMRHRIGTWKEVLR